jgi:hypothetical protein
MRASASIAAKGVNESDCSQSEFDRVLIEFAGRQIKYSTSENRQKSLLAFVIHKSVNVRLFASGVVTC